MNLTPMRMTTNMQTLLGVIQCLLAPILLMVALAVRFAGRSRVLNTVDYARVVDAAALHRWAGNRLLILPLCCALGGWASLSWPSWALPVFGAMLVALLAMAIWICLGAERFYAAAPCERD